MPICMGIRKGMTGQDDICSWKGVECVRGWKTKSCKLEDGFPTDELIRKRCPMNAVGVETDFGEGTFEASLNEAQIPASVTVKTYR